MNNCVQHPSAKMKNRTATSCEKPPAVRVVFEKTHDCIEHILKSSGRYFDGFFQSQLDLDD